MSNISTHTQNLSPDIVNYDVQRFGNIKTMKSPRAQLEKVSKEFEAIFVTKMLSTMDKSVDREGGIFGNDDKYMDKFKSFIYDEIGRDIAKNPRTSVGFAKQIYSQMERYLPAESDGQAVAESPSALVNRNHAFGERQYSKTAESDGQAVQEAQAGAGEIKGIKNQVDREI